MENNLKVTGLKVGDRVLSKIDHSLPSWQNIPATIINEPRPGEFEIKFDNCKEVLFNYSYYELVKITNQTPPLNNI